MASKAEVYIREQIPTMVGENHVSSMQLTTLIALLNGYAEKSKRDLKEKDLTEEVKAFNLKSRNYEEDA